MSRRVAVTPSSRMAIMPLRSVLVLAGGESRRFGRDKLAEPLDGGPGDPTVLDVLLEALSTAFPDAEVVVVGPRRPTLVPVRWVREEPPGGGPAAALVAGLRCVVDAGPDEDRGGSVAIVPGDAPGSAGAVALLAEALDRAVFPDAVAAMAVDGYGREQPLQLVLSPQGARRLVASVGDGRDLSVRPLVTALDPVRVQVPASTTWDVDTPEQLVAWRQRGRPAP